MLDITPEKLIPRKKAKSKPTNKRLEEINITFKNKVIVRNIDISADGSILNIIGQEHILMPHIQHLKPSLVELVSYYNKNDKRKIIYRYTNKDNFLPGNLFWVLKKWTRFYAIDTNTKEIEGINVSVTSVIQGYTLFVDAGYAHHKLDTYYTEANINDGTSNPETLAICKLISKVLKEYPENKNLYFGIITDSELELIGGFNFEVQHLTVIWCNAPSFRRKSQMGF